MMMMTTTMMTMMPSIASLFHLPQWLRKSNGFSVCPISIHQNSMISGWLQKFCLVFIRTHRTKTAGYCALGGLKQSDHRPVCDTWHRKVSCNHHIVTSIEGKVFLSGQLLVGSIKDYLVVSNI